MGNLVAYKDKEAESKQKQIYYRENREVMLASRRAYKAENREGIKKAQHIWYEENKERCKARTKQYYEQNKDRAKLWRRNRRHRIKIEALTYYGKGTLACVTCGENRLPCLTLDHINGGGRKHREAWNNQSIYDIVKKEGLPHQYQTLCMNCQFIKKFEENETRWKAKTMGKREDLVVI